MVSKAKVKPKPSAKKKGKKRVKKDIKTVKKKVKVVTKKKVADKKRKRSPKESLKQTSVKKKKIEKKKTKKSPTKSKQKPHSPKKKTKPKSFKNAPKSNLETKLNMKLQQPNLPRRGPGRPPKVKLPDPGYNWVVKVPNVERHIQDQEINWEAIWQPRIFQYLDPKTMLLGVARTNRLFYILTKECEAWGKTIEFDTKMFANVPDKRMDEILGLWKDTTTLLINEYSEEGGRTPNILIKIFKDCPKITTLHIKENQGKQKEDLELTDGVLMEIAKVPFNKLKNIHLEHCRKLTGDAIKGFVDSCEDLESLLLPWCDQLNDKLLTCVARAPKLKRVNFDYTGVSSVVMQEIVNNNLLLEEISVQRCIDTSWVSQITHHLSKLRKLDVSMSRLDDDGLKKITEFCPNIQALHLYYCPEITDDAAMKIATLTRLKTLDLTGTKLSSDVVAELVMSLDTLTEFGCSHTKSEWFTKINCTMPNMRRIHIANTLVKSNGIECVTRMFPNIYELDISGCFKVTDSTMKRIAKFARHLKRLDVHRTKITNKAVRHLMTLSGLETIDIRGCRKLTSKGKNQLDIHCLKIYQDVKEFSKITEEENTKEDADKNSVFDMDIDWDSKIL